MSMILFFHSDFFHRGIAAVHDFAVDFTVSPDLVAVYLSGFKAFVQHALDSAASCDQLSVFLFAAVIKIYTVAVGTLFHDILTFLPFCAFSVMDGFFNDEYILTVRDACL